MCLNPHFAASQCCDQTVLPPHFQVRMSGIQEVSGQNSNTSFKSRQQEKPLPKEVLMNLMPFLHFFLSLLTLVLSHISRCELLIHAELLALSLTHLVVAETFGS